MLAPPDHFYISGGTLPVDARCYVTREADDQLFDALRRGEFCYILTSRQMGKSSLMARTALRLRAEDLAVVVVDLTRIGQDLEREQWYYSLLMLIGQRLQLREELKAFWQQNGDLSLVQRWAEALHFLLNRLDGQRLVIFIDEIDNVLALPFKTDEFFAAIRACYNRRAEDPAFDRLAVCLLGVANPSDLIRDTRLTPFNIGRRIELGDFTPDEASRFTPGLGPEEILAQALLERVLHWTDGHPYLTQRLCEAVSQRLSTPHHSPLTLVDDLCGELFLSASAQTQDANLTFVRDRLLKSQEDETGLVNLLRLYERVWRGRRVADEESRPLVSLLRLSGIVRSVKGCLTVRNRLYARVFDRAWVRAHLPDAELRRERAAHRRQLLRIGSLSAVVLTLVGILAFIAVHQFQRAEREHRSAEKLFSAMYAMDMNLASQAYDNGDYGRVAQLLNAQIASPGDKDDLRGFEWRYFWRRMHQDKHTFIHKGKSIVYSVAFSPDGKTLASSNDGYKNAGGKDEGGTIKLWDIATQREIATLRGHTGGVFSIAFSPDGRLLASGSLDKDKTVKLWDVAARREVATLTGHKGGVYSVAFSRDGRWLASGDEGGGIILWDVYSRREVASRKGHKNSVLVAFSPDGRWLASGSYDGMVELWDVPFLRPEITLQGQNPARQVLSVAFSPDSKTLAVGRDDGTVELWDVLSQRGTILPRRHQAHVNGLAFSPDGKFLVSGSWDNTVRLWDVITRQPVGEPFIGHTNRVTSVAFSKDGRMLASGGSNEVKLWDINSREKNPRRLKAFPGGGPPYWIGPFTFSREGALRQLVVNRRNDTVTLWSYAGQWEKFPCHTHDSSAVALSPDGKTLAIGTEDGKAILWDVAAQRPEVRLPIDTRQITLRSVGGLAFSPDGRTLAAASGDPAMVTLWDIATRRQIARFEHGNAAKGIAFSPDGKTLAIANWQGRVYLWDLVADKQIYWRAHTKSVLDVAFSPDGKTLATASEDGTVKLWNVATQREMVTLKASPGSVSHIAFSPDGNTLASSDGKTILLWRASSLAEADEKGP